MSSGPHAKIVRRRSGLAEIQFRTITLAPPGSVRVVQDRPPESEPG